MTDVTAGRYSRVYYPGGPGPRARWREIGRRGGLASGVKRRQLAKGKRAPRARSREQALALRYRHRQLTRDQFARLYRREWPTGYEAGLETLWEHYQAVFLLYRLNGQHYRTTNAQRAAALAAKGRERCPRTIRRLNRKLELLGVAVVSHYKDQRATPGHCDCLVVEIRWPRSRDQKCPPPFGSRNRTTSGGSCLPPRTFSEGRAACTALSPPTSSAETVRAASPPVTRRDEIERLLAFHQLKLDMGWDDRRIRQDMAYLKAELRSMPPCPPPAGLSERGERA